ncbi:MAG: metallophosphoesterase [Acidobacteriota bacterium]
MRGPVHFFAVDSDGAEPDGNTENSVQGNWLKNKLTSATEPWKIVYFHHPPYSSGKHGSTTGMRWHFKEWGASAVLSGHDHTYERLNVNGLPYFVNGLGGADRYDFVTILSTSQVRYNATYGAMLVDADSDSITFKFYNTAGTLIDTYSLSVSNPSGIAAPSGLQAQAVSGSQINLSWNDNSNNESGFDIERCAGANCTSFARIALVGLDAESYSDPTIAAGDYRYRVRGFNASGNSAFSNIANVSTSAPSDVFGDDFNDGVIDLSKWTVGMFSRSVSYLDLRLPVEEQDGALKIVPDSLVDGTHYNGIKSVRSWNLTGSSATVEVVQAAENKAVTMFAVGTDKNNWLAFRAKGGTLYVERRVDAVTSNDQLDYDKVANRFWRIRHDSATDTIVFETSADENTWVVASTVPRPFPIDAMRFELSAGASDAITGPGEAVFDNFRFGPN